MKKQAYSAMMSYEVTNKEKEQAEKCLHWLSFIVKQLKQAEDHLDLIYNPFKKNPQVSGDKIFKVRAVLRRYRDKVVLNFNEFKKNAFKCYVLLQIFTSDTQTDKLVKSFVDIIEDIETQVNRFIELFDNLKSDDFGKICVTAIENIKKEIAQFEEIVNERIKTHIQTNILAKNWVDHVSTELQEKVEKKAPLTMRLVEERNKLLVD